MEWSLRPFTEDDLDLVVQIENEVHSTPWTKDQFKAELEKPYSCFWVCTDDETDTQIAGYIVFWVLFEECQILNIAVTSAWRGLGIAKSMIRKCISNVAHTGVKKIVLDVRKSNEAALQLYQGVGFSIESIRKGFYINSEDAYHMSLLLE